MSPRKIQDQGKFVTNEEQVFQAPIDPLAELAANSEVHDAILLLARVVTTQLNRQKLTLENLRVREVWGDNDAKYKRMLKVRNEKRKLCSSCVRCGKNYKGGCLWALNVCYRCGDKGHKQKNCPAATRLRREKKLKEGRIEEGLSFDDVMVPNDKVPMISQAYNGTSSSKCKF